MPFLSPSAARTAVRSAVGFATTDVEAEVDLFEAGVERDGDAFDADLVEEEGDEGDVALALIEIELKASRQPRRELLWRDFVLRHDELAPLGREEGGHVHTCYLPSLRLRAASNSSPAFHSTV